MDRELTRQELQAVMENMRAAFGSVTADELDLAQDQEPPQTDEEMRVDYELRDGRICCVLTRCVAADGKVYRLRVNAPLNGEPRPESSLTERERAQCCDEQEHEPISGVYTRRYLERKIIPQIAQWHTQGVPVAMALISLDQEGELLQKHGHNAMTELMCTVANNWKKYYYGSNDRVVCNLTGSQFVVVCSCMTGRRLAEEMRSLYAGMHCECTITNGCCKQIPYTLTVACAGLDEVDEQEAAQKPWRSMYALCNMRLCKAAEAGGDCVVCAENDPKPQAALRAPRTQVQ